MDQNPPPMIVPRNVACPIILTICILSFLTTAFCFLVSTDESLQLEHLRVKGPDFSSPALTNVLTEAEMSELKAKPLPLPSVTDFYFRWHGIAILLPLVCSILGGRLLRAPECQARMLAWFVCLSLILMLVWSAYTYLAVHVGFVAYTYYL